MKKPTHKEVMAAIDAMHVAPLKTIPQWLRRAVLAIEQDILDRRGLKREYEQIDEDVRSGIRDKWAAIIAAQLRATGPQT